MCLHSTFGRVWIFHWSRKIIFTAHWVEYDLFVSVVKDALLHFFVKYSLFMGRVKVSLKLIWLSMICPWLEQKRLHSSFGRVRLFLGSIKILFTAHWVEFNVFMGLVKDALQHFCVENSLFMGRAKMPLEPFWVEHGF